jgi:hypothetical protein
VYFSATVSSALRQHFGETGETWGMASVIAQRTVTELVQACAADETLSSPVVR